MSESPKMEPEYGVLRPTLMGGEPDTLDYHDQARYNTRAWAEAEVASWRSRGQRAHVVTREWQLWRPSETYPAEGPLQDVHCAWCDDRARGSAFFPGNDYWYASCGRLLHGFAFEPTERWRDG